MSTIPHYQTHFAVDETPLIPTPTAKPHKKSRKPKRKTSEYEYEYVVESCPTTKISEPLLDSRPRLERSVPSNLFFPWTRPTSSSQPVEQQKPSWSLSRAVSASISTTYSGFRHPIRTLQTMGYTVSRVTSTTANAITSTRDLLERLVDKEWCKRNKLIVIMILLGLACCLAVGMWGLIALVVGFAFVGLLLWMFLF